MPSFTLYSNILVLSLLTLIPITTSQFLSTLPQCIQTCINNSNDESCSAADIKCLCRASSGNFLPDTITCMHSNCDSDIDSDLLLDPLQWVCQLAGAPIPSSAMSRASVAGMSTSTATATATVTMTAASSSTAIGTGTGTSSKSILSTSTSTVTSASTTVTSTPTLTPASSTSSSTGVGAGGGASSNSPAPTLDTSVAPALTSSSKESVSKTSTAPSEDQTNSSPFKDTNNAGERRGVGYLVGLSALVVAGFLWV